MSNRDTITLADVVTKSDNFVESNIDGEAILMHLDQGSFSSLKSTGLRVWELLETPKSVADICDQLQAEFEVDEAVCAAQTLKFLEGLRDADLVTVSN